jgi:hypothetical protein
MAFCQPSFLSRITFCDAARFGFAVTLLGTAAATAAFAGDARPDTSTIVQSELRSDKVKNHDWKKFNVVPGTSNSIRERHHDQTAHTVGGTSRNAIGLAAHPEDLNKGAGNTERNLVRVPIEGSLSIPAGAAAKNDQGISTLDGVPQISAPATALSVTRTFPAASTLARSAVNGSSLPRSGSGTAVLGGPAKNLTGAISGVDFRPKHP